MASKVKSLEVMKKANLFRKQIVATVLLMILCFLGHYRWVPMYTWYEDYPENKYAVLHQRDKYSKATRDIYWVDNEYGEFDGQTYTPRYEKVVRYENGWMAHLATAGMIAVALVVIAWFYSNFMLGDDRPSSEEIQEAAKSGVIAIASFHVLVTFRFATYVLLLLILLFLLRYQNRNLKAEIEKLKGNDGS